MVGTYENVNVTYLRHTFMSKLELMFILRFRLKHELYVCLFNRPQHI